MLAAHKAQVKTEIIALESQPIRRCLALLFVPGGEFPQSLFVVARSVFGSGLVRGEMSEKRSDLFVDLIKAWIAFGIHFLCATTNELNIIYRAGVAFRTNSTGLATYRSVQATSLISQ